MIIDGKSIAQNIEQELKEKIQKQNLTLTLAVVLVGDDPASQIYVRNKGVACQRVGIKSITVNMPSQTSQAELEQKIKELAQDNNINGILLQLPLPKGLDERRAIELIPANKDVDGLTFENFGKLFTGRPSIVPCTPLGCILLLESVTSDFDGKDAVVIGRSNLVGKPVAQLLLQKNCSVTNLHSKSKDIKKYVKNADIVVCAVGKSGLLKQKDFKSGAIVIDVGINRGLDGKLCGDVEKGERQDIFVTPVPKGVGPMTIAMLLCNTYKCFCLQQKN